MSDTVWIVLIVFSFLLVIVLRFPEETKKLFSRIKKLDAGKNGLSVTFFEDQAAKAAERHGGTAPKAPNGRVLENCSILWVDDIPENNFHEAAMFEALGADVQFARTNQAAVAIASNSRPTLVLSDIGRESESESGLELPSAFEASGIAPSKLIYYTGSKTADTTPQGHLVTTIPSELFNAVIKAIGEPDQ